jgi:hypothetical protein
VKPVRVVSDQLAPGASCPPGRDWTWLTGRPTYQHKSYAYRAQRLEEFDRFLRRMQAGNLVLTTMPGKIYIGRLIGPAYFAESRDGLSNLRRDVAWLDPERPVDAARLEAPVPALLQSQAYVVDLTEAYHQLASFVPDEEKTDLPASALLCRREQSRSIRSRRNWPATCCLTGRSW